MSDDVRFERLLADVLSDVAPTRVPDRLVPDILAAASQTRRRPRWLALATEPPMRRRAEVLVGSPKVRLAYPLSMVALLALLAVSALVVGGIVRPRELAVVVVPSPSLPGVVAPSSTPSGPSVGPTASPVTNPAGVWIATGTMGTPRYDHAAVRLLDGRVLVMGGSSGDRSDVTSVELYDPDTGTWSATGNTIRPHSGFPATLLRDGRLLVGVALGEDRPGAELYDPNSGTWSATGQMVPGATGEGTATLLSDGKVLVAGLDGAQLYDPNSGTWTATGKMTTPRFDHTATLLPDGRVLAAGGYVLGDLQMDVAELYDPNTGSWTAIANMHARHGHHTATLLLDGKVLVADSSGMEVYDPATGTWTALPVRPGVQSVTLLSDGRVLLPDPLGPESVGAELYDPSTGTWTTAAPMLRSHGTPAILLLDGTVLVAGGFDCLDGGVCVATGSAELYVPAGVSPPPLPAFPSPLPPVFPSPTPRPTPFPPEAGPVPAGARSWIVRVVNNSSAPGTLFLAEDDGIGQLCGSVTPNVVPAGVSMKVTFLLPPKRVKSCWIWVNPVPGQGGLLFQTSDAPMAGEIFIQVGGQGGWASP
jgi:Kelch motif/Galactose oxidase, central domain